MTFNPIPFMMNDKTKNLLRGHFCDVDSRMDVYYASNTMADGKVTMAVKYENWDANEASRAVLTFGAEHALGMLSIQKGPTIHMSQFFPTSSIDGISRDRKFTGTDGREYRFQYEVKPGQQWTCTTGKDEFVASYDEPDEYSDYMLVIMPDYAKVGLEIVCASMIFRHIITYGL